MAQPEARFGTIGTEVPPGEAAMVRFRFCVTAAGPVRLSVDANTGSPSPPNLAQLAACLTYAGGSCSPHVPFLNPSYFDIGDAEVKRHRLYELRVENVGPGAIRFADMNVSWTSTAHWMRVLDVTIGAYPNDCVDAAGGDYLGCQAKFRWPTGAGGSATIAASYTGSGTFELKVKTRVDPAAICRGTISNGKPAKCAVVHEPEGDWWHATVKKYTAGKPSPPTFTITWP